MAAQTLRALARQYAKGELDKDAYHQSRAEFVEKVLSGEVKLQANNYPAPRSQARADGENTNRKPRKKKEAEDITSIMVTTGPTPTGVAPAVEEPEPMDFTTEDSPSRFPVSYMAAAAGAALVIAIIVVALLPDSSDTGPAAPATQPEAEAEISSPAPEQTLSRPAGDLILKFLSDKNWSEAARSEFLAQWQALPEDQRAGAAQSGEMAQLNNSINKKLLEERALSGLGDPAVSAEKQRALIEFAAALGIQDSRLSVPAASP